MLAVDLFRVFEVLAAILANFDKLLTQPRGPELLHPLLRQFQKLGQSGDHLIHLALDFPGKLNPIGDVTVLVVDRRSVVSSVDCKRLAVEVVKQRRHLLLVERTRIQVFQIFEADGSVGPFDQEYIWSLGRIVDVARYLSTASGI